jgi:general secretion pathway protein K
VIRRVHHRGVALLTAMLITALTGSLAAGLAWNNALDVRRTMVLLFHEQGMQVALGAESWIRNILRDDGIESQTDHLGELWASELPGLPVDNDSVQGAVSGQIEDLQGRFNVNNLIDSNGEVNEDVLEQFQRLLVSLEIDPRFAGLTADWIDADQEAGFPDGAEDSIYTGLTPPYRTLNRTLSNVTELAALEGMDAASFRALLPHVTALPPGTQINVNTATPVVLQSLDANIDATMIEDLLSQREESGFIDFTQTFSTLVTNPEIFAQLTESSSFFQLKAVVQIDTVRVTYYSVLSRSPSGGPVTTILRSLGTI